MKEHIGNVYTILQQLDIQPTASNVEKLDFVYKTLRKIYTELDNNDKQEMEIVESEE